MFYVYLKPGKSEFYFITESYSSDSENMNNV